MKSRDKKLLIGGIIIALIIAVLAPFLASSNPDGLESTAEKVKAPETEPVIQSPIPDYTIPGLGKVGEVLALVIGTIIVLIIAYGISIAVKTG